MGVACGGWRRRVRLVARHSRLALLSRWLACFVWSTSSGQGGEEEERRLSSLADTARVSTPLLLSALRSWPIVC